MIGPLLVAAGCGLLVLALLHVAFPRRFGWQQDLAQVTLLNRQLFYVHTLFIAVTVAIFGGLSILIGWTWDGTGTPLTVAVLGAFALFWSIRLAVQLFVFDRRLWKGDRFNTAIHVLFTAVWTGLTLLYAVAAWMAWR